MFEGVVASIIASGFSTGGSAAVQKVRETLRERRFSTEIDDLATVFNQEVHEALTEVAAEGDADIARDIAREWETVAVELDRVDVLFQDETVAINEVTDAILEAGVAEATTPDEEAEIRQAVTRAIKETIVQFRQTVAGTDLADELHATAEVEITRQLDAVETRLTQLERNLRRPRFYDVFDAETEIDQAVETICERGGANASIEYVSRPEIDDIVPTVDTLLVGRKGAGKTRALAQVVEAKAPQTKLEHIVVVDRALTAEEDILPLLRESFEGNVLLVWDDIHRDSVNPVFRAAVQKLRREVERDDATLWILATARAEAVDDLAGGVTTEDDPIYSTFEQVQLGAFDRSQVETLLEEALAWADIDCSPTVKTHLTTQVLKTDPSPFYIQSVVSSLDDYTGPVTPADIEDALA